MLKDTTKAYQKYGGGIPHILYFGFRWRLIYQSICPFIHGLQDWVCSGVYMNTPSSLCHVTVTHTRLYPVPNLMMCHNAGDHLRWQYFVNGGFPNFESTCLVTMQRLRLTLVLGLAIQASNKYILVIK
jgi:hypothetical protein